MSGISYYPPTTYFNNISFNNDFYAIPNNNQGISLAYANTHFLFSTGVATSTAVSTFFSGSIGIGTISGTAGTLNALTINAINSIQFNGTDMSSIYDTIIARQNAITSLSNILQTNINNNLIISSNYTDAKSNILQTNINNNLIISSNYTDAKSNILQPNINNNLIISSNYTSNTSNILKLYIDTNLIFSSNYTDAKISILQINIVVI